MFFLETIRISVMVSIDFFFIDFFQQGNDTRTVMHIIDNIELKLDFANLKSQIKSQSQYLSKKIAIRYFAQIAQPYSELLCSLIFSLRSNSLNILRTR